MVTEMTIEDKAAAITFLQLRYAYSDSLEMLNPSEAGSQSQNMGFISGS